MATIVHAPATSERPAARGLRGMFVRLHRYVGLAIAAFLVLVSVTGSILVFQQEIDAWLNPDLWALERSGASLSPQQIAYRVEAADPRVIARWIPLETRPQVAADVWVEWKPDPQSGAPALRRYDQMFVDPVTGKVNGTRRYGACCLEREHFIPFIYYVHSSLFMPGRAGAILLGIVGILWTLDSFVGLYLTFPQGGGFWRGWRRSWRIKLGGSLVRRIFDLHRAPGLWLWPLLILMGISSVALALEHEIVEPVVERFSTVSPEPWEGRPPPSPATAMAPRVSFDQALEIASAAARAAGIEEPNSGLFLGPEIGMYGVRFGREEEAGIGQGWIYVDSMSGEVVKAIPATSGTAGDVFMRMQLPIHAGRLLGLPTRILAVLVGLGTAMLAITGVLIWLRKRRARIAPVPRYRQSRG